MKTTKVYISSLLAEKFPDVNQQLNIIFRKYNKQLVPLENTKDIWCRDYMPIQMVDGSYIQFLYTPDYLMGYENLISDPQLINEGLGLQTISSDIILDGGNLVRLGNKAILTDKIFVENPAYTKIDLVREVKELLKLDELIVIPRQPYEMTGHADGMVRFIDEDTVLLNDFSHESKSFNTKLKKVLMKAGLKIESLRYTNSFYTLERDWGAYLNYLELEDIMIIPTFGIVEDVEVVSRFNKIFPKHKIIPIVVPELIKEGGALNCISWT